MYKYILIIFLLFIILYYIWLSINPIEYNRGNKNDILDYIKDYTMEFVYIDHKKKYNDKDIKYPKIFTPLKI
jgi:hypothetical protein